MPAAGRLTPQPGAFCFSGSREGKEVAHWPANRVDLQDQGEVLSDFPATNLAASHEPGADHRQVFISAHGIADVADVLLEGDDAVFLGRCRDLVAGLERGREAIA